MQDLHYNPRSRNFQVPNEVVCDGAGGLVGSSSEFMKLCDMSRQRFVQLSFTPPNKIQLGDILAY